MGIFSKRRTEELIRDEDRVARSTHVIMTQASNDIRCERVEQSGCVARIINGLVADTRQRYITDGSVGYARYELSASDEKLCEDMVIRDYIYKRIKAEIPKVDTISFSSSGKRTSRMPRHNRPVVWQKAYISIMYKNRLR